MSGKWKAAAQRLGEELADVGPAGYYSYTAKDWLKWASRVVVARRDSMEQAQHAASVSHELANHNFTVACEWEKRCHALEAEITRMKTSLVDPRPWLPEQQQRPQCACGSAKKLGIDLYCPLHEKGE